MRAFFDLHDVMGLLYECVGLGQIRVIENSFRDGGLLTLDVHGELFAHNICWAPLLPISVVLDTTLLRVGSYQAVSFLLFPVGTHAIF